MWEGGNPAEFIIPASFNSRISHWNGFGSKGRGWIRQKEQIPASLLGVKSISELEVGWEQPWRGRRMGEGHFVEDLQVFHLHFHAGHPLGSEGAKTGLCLSGRDEDLGCPSPQGFCRSCFKSPGRDDFIAP